MSGPIDGFSATETGADPLVGIAVAEGPGDAYTSALDSERIETVTLPDADGADAEALGRGPEVSAERAGTEIAEDTAHDTSRQAGVRAVSAAEVVIADPDVDVDGQQAWGPGNTYQTTGRYEGGETTSSIAGSRTNETVLSSLDTDQLGQHVTWAEGLEQRGDHFDTDTRSASLAAMSYRTSGALEFLDRYRDPQHQAFQERRAQLESLDHDGFNRGQINELRDIVAASGLPTHGLTSFMHEEARELGESGGQVIASMHTHGPEAGRFTVYDCYDQAPMEEKKATVIHEMTHNLSALRPENNEIFGEGEAGEQERLATAEYVSRVVDQSLVTGVHLNGYHKHLMEEYNNTKHALEAARDLDPEVQGQHITPEEYDEYLAQARYKLTEETQAILIEMSFFKRAELERVQAVQVSKLADQTRIARIDPDSELLPESVRGHGVDGLPRPIDLITSPGERGNQAQGVGADRIAITLLRGSGVTNYDDLMRHIDDFKGVQWGNRSPRVQRQREIEFQDS